MYRIFRGPHLLILTDNEQDSNAFKPDFIIKKPTEDQIKEMLRLSKSSTKALVIILIGKPKKLLRKISTEFKVVEAAGGLVFNHKNEILAIKRLGKWDLPKGKHKEGEDLEACAIREVEEETGAQDLNIIRQLTETYHTYFRNRKWILKRTYWYVMECGDGSQLKPQHEEDIEEVRWFKFKKLNPKKLDTYPAIRWILEEYKLSVSETR